MVFAVNLVKLWEIGNPPTSYRSLSDSPGLNSQKSLEKVSKGLWPQGPKKSGQNLEKEPKSLAKVSKMSV